MISVLGYLAYALICAFSPLQLWGMVRGKNIDLGAWPLVSLTAGLALLAGTFAFVTVPMYVIVGTTVSMAGCAANLALILRLPSRIAALFRKTVRDGSRTLPQTPGAVPNENFCSVERAPSLNALDFVQCETCGCTLFILHAFAVEHIIHSLTSFIVRHQLPAHEDVLPSDYTFYCKIHKRPYDRFAEKYPHRNDGLTPLFWQVTGEEEQFD